MHKSPINFLIIFFIAISLSSCTPATIGNLVTSGARITKSASNRLAAKSLEGNDSSPKEDTLKYSNYFIYRSGSIVGSALSCLIYDNNKYVTVVNVRTFEKVSNVIAGDHLFTSEIESKRSIKFNFTQGKTYLIQAYASTNIRKGVLVIMSQDMIKRELAKGNFFSKKFLEMGLKVEDFSY